MRNCQIEDAKRYLARFDEITYNMCSRMKNSPRTTNISYNFTGEMIPHHEGAIEMCNNLLKYPIDPRLREIAENIITTQTNGVRELKKLQNELRR